MDVNEVLTLLQKDDKDHNASVRSYSSECQDITILTDDSTSNDSDFDYDLSDPEAEAETQRATEMESDDVSEEEITSLEPPDTVSFIGFSRHGSRRGCSHGRGEHRRDDLVSPLDIHDLLDVDQVAPKKHDFKPSRHVAAYLPASVNASSPVDLFKLFFDDVIVQKICDVTNEYAERQNNKKETMYRYFQKMVPDDFYAFM
uniref:PiggyBac transposable element-derived protein domain-containing protein n=1 Tax=Amphimedon queenslandica TaxID=400682 RepID=A0A1X7VRZ2_AMPQE